LKRGKLLFSGGRCLGSFQDNPGGHIFPEGDQQSKRRSKNPSLEATEWFGSSPE
jgi:hypothetical protein